MANIRSYKEVYKKKNNIVWDSMRFEVSCPLLYVDISRGSAVLSPNPITYCTNHVTSCAD